MPIYEYVCTECDSSEEHNVSVKHRDSYIECSVCGGVMKRAFGVGGVYVR